MLDSCRMTAIVGGLFVRVAVRSPAYLLLVLVASLAVMAATIPVSPGVVAGEAHYLEAGASTLLLGGVLLCVVLLPGLQVASRGRWNEETLLSLPVEPEVFTLGVFVGFGAAVGIYTVICGGVFIVTAQSACSLTGLGNLLLSAASCFLLSLTVAAMVTAFRAVLAPVPALIAVVLLVVAGQAGSFWPAAVSFFLPPFDLLDPGSLARCSAGTVRDRAHGEICHALGHGVACVGFYLCLAVVLLKARRWRAPIGQTVRG